MRAFIVAAVGILAGSAFGQSESEKPEMNEHEKAFVERLTGATLEGRFTVTDLPIDPGPKPDKYTITKVEKKDGNNWLFIARVEYSGGSYPIAIKIPVEWAGDTPVISVTKLEIPAVAKGSFHARVLIDGERYAGTWGHDQFGGHMWGKIVKAPGKDKPAEASKGEKDNGGSTSTTKDTVPPR